MSRTISAHAHDTARMVDEPRTREPTSTDIKRIAWRFCIATHRFHTQRTYRRTATHQSQRTRIRFAPLNKRLSALRRLTLEFLELIASSRVEIKTRLLEHIERQCQPATYESNCRNNDETDEICGKKQIKNLLPNDRVTRRSFRGGTSATRNVCYFFVGVCVCLSVPVHRAAINITIRVNNLC